jgi:F-type H+-transporting ATPase subunit c
MKSGKWLVFLFVGAVLFLAGSALAQEEAAKVVLSDDVKKWLGLAAGFGIAIASFGGALGQGRAIAAAVEGVARNPGAAGKIFAPTLIVGLALIESLVLYAWIVALQLAGKI